MSVLVELSLFPIGAGETVHTAVAEAVALIRESGLPHILGPMGTTIEGEWDEVMAVVSHCYKALAANHNRIYMTMKVDARRGHDGRLSSKVKAVESLLA
jgi:uncharacterized protein (TIGR00106 family)